MLAMEAAGRRRNRATAAELSPSACLLLGARPGVREALRMGGFPIRSSLRLDGS
jgi:hypothetical protein